MINDKPCYISEMVKKFMLMTESDMHMVYLLTKDYPCVKKAYEQAKLLRSQKK